jgi:multidrug efflux pump subunit AcrB
MREIRIPLMMSTFTIILAFVPLGFITGMMGPYMAPMALNVPVTVMLSTFIAFFVTPWLAYKIYVSRVSSSPASASDSQGGDEHRLYRRMLMPLIGSRQRAKWFLWFIAFLFVITAMLPMLRLVPLKLLPFDNKNELQVLIDMPEGATLEQTRAVAQQVQSQVLRMPEIKAVAAYIGEPSPIDFNGLVRKYYARVGKHYGDLRLTLVDKTEREHQSHGVLLRLRPLLAEIEEQTGAKIKPVEVPPGPPVLSTLVAEIYGQADTSYARLQQASEQVMARLGREDGVVDVDSNALAAQQRLRFVPDQRKAALSGISTADIAQTLMMANAGMEVTQLQLENEISPLAIDIRLDESDRASVESLLMLGVRGQPGIVRERRGQGLEPAPQPLVPLAELGEFVSLDIDQPIFHKDLRPVVYVTAETAGRPPAEIVTDIQADQRFNDEVQAVANDEGVRPASQRTFLNMGGNDLWSVADDVEVVWSGEGEWKITIRVFRDMGLAFAFALLGIFIVLRFQTSSSALSLIIMSAIPLTVIGLMPGFWVLNMIGEREIAGFPEPVLFTATAMIGMIALAGIVVRNSLILVEFINNALKEGMPLIDALVQAGSTRMRPVLLTAGTTLLGNLVIVLDPVFSGLAWSIIFGIIASTAFTLLVIPCVYFMVFGNAQGELKASPK